MIHCRAERRRGGVVALTNTTTAGALLEAMTTSGTRSPSAGLRYAGRSSVQRTNIDLDLFEEPREACRPSNSLVARIQLQNREARDQLL